MCLKTKYYALLLFFFWLSPNLLSAQQLSFRHYTTQDGLPSGTVYNVTQDHDGFLWISTENGLCKFDGRNFYLDPIPPLQSEEIIGIHTDNNKRKWVFPLDCQAMIYHNDRLLFLKDLIDSKDCFLGFQQLSNDYIALSTPGHSIYIVNSETLKPVASDLLNRRGKKVMIKPQNANILLLDNTGVFEIHPDKEDITHSTQSPLSDNVTKHNIAFDESRYLIVDGKKIWWFDINKMTFEKAFPNLWKEDFLINDILKDTHGDLWLVTSNGIFQIKPSRQPTIIHHLEGIFMHTIYEDNDQNLWFSSRRNGLYLLSNTKIQFYQYEPTSSAQIAVLTPKNESETWAAFSDGQLALLDNTGKIIKKNQLGDQVQIYDILQTENSTLISADNGLFEWTSNNTLQQLNTGSIKTAALDQNGELWVATYNGTRSNSSKQYITNDRTYKLLVQDDNIWLGTVNGLQKYSTKTQKLISIDILPNVDVRDIAVDDNNQFWIATQGRGLFVFKDGKILKTITKQEGLLSNNCNKVIHTPDFSWIATNKGLARIDRRDYSIQNLSKQLGLPSNEINTIRSLDSTLLVGTNNGLAIFNANIPLKNQVASPHILDIQINGQDTSLHKEYYLSHDDNNLTISFTGIHFKEGKNIRFQYKMAGRDGQWLESKNDVAFYSDLKPGQYNFLLKAKVPNTDWSPPISVQFYIAPPFWSELWFIILGFLATTALLGACFYWINQLRNRKDRLEAKLSESQLRALRSQMNPHFIFNALNAIQGFIFQEDRRSANRYLSYFSKLMRNAFFYSDKSEIPLKAEIENLELYLKLEGLRFGGDLKYDITVDSNIPTEYTQIPSMIVQPYLENAINNGIMHIEGEKLLYIRLFKEGEQLICEIEDNGLDRNEARMIRQRNKLEKSKSLGATFERLQLFNAGYKNRIQIEEIPLIESDHGFNGTKIKIIVNNVFKYEDH